MANIADYINTYPALNLAFVDEILKKTPIIFAKLHKHQNWIIVCCSLLLLAFLVKCTTQVKIFSLTWCQDLLLVFSFLFINVKKQSTEKYYILCKCS